MADAYKLKVDASFPQPLLEDQDGNVIESVGRNYTAGSYVLADQLTKRMRDRADNGELDHLLEAASKEDAEAAQNAKGRLVVIPEHEAEAVVLGMDPTKLIVPRDQAIELGAAGSDAAQEAQEAAKADGADERPGLTADEVPSLAANERGDGNDRGIVPSDTEHVDEAELVGVERPPGVPVGSGKAAAEGADVSETPAAAPRRRGRPRAADQEAKKVSDNE